MVLRLLAVASVLSASTVAQSFSYTDFSTVSDMWASLPFGGGPFGAALRLTPNGNDLDATVWRAGSVFVHTGFDTTFAFRITPPPTGTVGNGMAFVIQDDLDPYPGGEGSAHLGYGATGSLGINNSIAIEIDTAWSPQLADTSSNEISIHTRGQLANSAHEQYSIGRVTPTTTLADGAIHMLRIRHVPGTLEVFLDGATTPVISVPYDFATGGTYLTGAAALPPMLTNGTARLGFTATTGVLGMTQTTDLLSWTWTSLPIPDPCYAGSVGQDLLFVQNSPGNFFRDVELASRQFFTISLQAPSSFGPGAPYVLLLSLAPQPGAPGTALGFGSMCMPILPPGPTEIVLADSFGFFSPLFAAASTPAAFTIPAGIVDFPFSLQAVVATSLSPFALGVTNAIDLRFTPALPPFINVVYPLPTPGQLITISGGRFLPEVAVTLNGVPVPLAGASTTAINFWCPANPPCSAQLTVTNPDLQSATASLPFNPALPATSLNPASGPAAGGTVVTTSYTLFATPGASSVTVGGVPATFTFPGGLGGNVAIVTPPGAPGVVPVVFTTPGGCTTTAMFTYQ